MVHPSVGSTLYPTHVQPGTEAVPSPSLHRALESLMVNLDDEILRYRHSRTGQGPSPVPQRKLTFRPKARTSPSLITLKATPEKRPPGAIGSIPATSALKGSPLEGNPMTPPLNASPAPRAGSTVDQPSPSPSAMGNRLMPYTPAPDSFLESSTALLRSAPSPASAMATPAPYHPEAYYHDEADYRPSLAERISTPLGMGALLLLLVGSAGFGYLMTSPTAIDHLRNHIWVQRWQPDPAPEAEAEATPAPEPSLPTGLQGIGPDLSGQEMGELNLDRVSRLPVEPSRPGVAPPAGEPAPDAEATAGREGAAATVARPQPTNSPPTGTLRTEPVAPLTPRQTSLPTTVAPSRVVPGPAQAVPQPRATQPPAASRPIPSPVAAPAPPAALAQPPQPLGTVTTRSTPTPPPPLAPTTSSAAARPSNYYVVTDYTGNPSLESARGVVSDAYVRNFQGSPKIQMGAFSQESSAHDLVQQLQQQGIPAQIYNTP